MIKNVKVFYAPTGRIFVGELFDGHKIEFTEMKDVLMKGDKHSEVRNTTNLKIIWKHLTDYKDKWLLNVSTQRGCVHNCKFCDVSKLPYKGNLSKQEIMAQIDYIIKCSPYVIKSNKVKLGFARMGEPAHNIENVLFVMKEILNKYPQFKWLPCFNSILPRKTINGQSGFEIIDKVIEFKEKIMKGNLHFQISCNTTNENIRRKLFGGTEVLNIQEIIKYISNNFQITKRKITLNFILIDSIPLDIKELLKLNIDKEKFIVKLIPLNDTKNSIRNKLKSFGNFSEYNKLLKLGKQLESNNIPVVYDAVAKIENEGLCCGQLINL